MFSFARFDDLPFDKQNVRYSNWKEVYNNMLELAEKDKFLKLPQDIFNFLVLFISFEEILDFLNKICSHKPDYCDKRQDFWTLLWKRDVNDNPPPFQGVKEKYLAFVDEFNKKTNKYKKLHIAAKFGAVNQPIFISAFNEETEIQKKFYLAVIFGELNLVNNLISQGASISADNYFSFRLASRYGHLETLRFLIHLDPVGVKANNYEALHLNPEGVKANNYEALHLAAANGHLEVVRFLADLDKEGIKVDNYEALRLAALKDHLEMVHFLVDLDPEGVKAYNYEALRYAARNGYLEVVRFLANLGPEGIKANNYEALRWAAANGYLEVVRLLADLDPEGIKVDNYEALRLAAEIGYLEVVQFLLSKIENLSEIPDNIKISIKNKNIKFI